MSNTTSTRSGAPSNGPAVFAAQADLAVIGDQLIRLQRPAVSLQAGGPDAAAAWCAANELPSVLLVDISGHAHPIAALLELAALTGPACRIVALGDKQDVDLYRQLLQAGIFDYLMKPPRLDLLTDTLARADDDAPLGQGGNARAGRSAAIVGAAGGLGVSTLTAALGLWLAHSRQTPTVLVDFDRRKGDLPLLLGLEADAGLASLLSAPDIDPRLLQRTLLAAGHVESQTPDQPSARLQLLAQRPGPETPFDPERALEIGGALCQWFSLSLWDLPSHRPAGADEVLAHADIRVVLTELTVQGARNTHRVLAELGDSGGSQRLVLVASEARHAQHAPLELAQFEDFVGRRIDQHLPYAGPALAASLLKGPLSLQAAPVYAQAVAQLGTRILGLPSAAATKDEGALRRLRSWLNRPAPARRTARA
ncbi:hypothetical protein RAS12_20515 [Achromobacter seleniivolatilans]|uniref:Response regulatory domain-containing protein n=1 Tax=Achromobacter seleniivolatilans TaxID=3047478 RepID=A0ABY9LXA4_9BURK|nr:hypothetical protein [Achromobacter sp. R39]WMD18993.1 hypothetical protein RAS12_20515 [Achromobacter sp. R39]